MKQADYVREFRLRFFYFVFILLQLF